MKKPAKNNLDYYLSLPYTIDIIPDPEGGFFAQIKELPGCMTQGETLEEVYEMIKDAQRLWLETAIEEGIEFPLPESMEEEKYSGRILIRIPRYLHKKLKESAKKEGVSLNTYIVSLLSKKEEEGELLIKIKELLESPSHQKHKNYYI